MERRSYVIGFALVWQLCWVLVVAGAGSRLWPASLSLAITLLAVHLAAQGAAARRELPVLAAAAAFGLLGDSLLSASGLVDYRADLTGTTLAPVWIVVLWLWFACALHHPLSFLQQGRYVLAAVLGALSGPLAYLGGERLGAIAFPDNAPLALLGVAVLYGSAVPALTHIARLSSRRPVHA
ncbi:MAG: DUF2878 domain-containing protein [Planctomycetota bacterium]|nr:DUF2878 domain-containing protein [Planctomycetota bacterium]